MWLLVLCLVGVSTITGTFGEKPRLEIQPGAVVVKPVGSSLALSCKPIVENPRLVTHLEWKDTKNQRIDVTSQQAPIHIEKLKGEVASVLIFSSLTENLAGNYTCTASYANSEQLKSTTRVTTIVDITWVDAPESQYPILGKDSKIKCEVKANPGPTINWLKNGEEIDFATTDHYVFANTGLIIKNVKESDDGVYTCKAVVFSTGDIRTRNIKVEVQVIPQIYPMGIVEVIEGEEASVLCNGTGKPPPSYTWIKENSREDLSTSDRFTVKKNSGLLILHRVEYISDNSYYKCIAKNPAGQNETRVRINVLIKPKIYELLNITAPVNSSTRIICKAFGRPAPRVLFRKLSNKEPFLLGQHSAHPGIILENFPNESKGETIGILNFDRLYRSDDGLYECIAENKVENAYKNGHVTVEFPPTFEKTENYPPVWSWPDNPGNLTCIAESIPNATIQWRYNGIIIQENMQIRQHGNGPISHLIVDPMNEQRFYTTYECVATNRLGSAIKKIELRKATIPQHIQQVKPDQVTATTVKFNIVGPPNYYGLPLRSIVVQYQNERLRSWDTAKEHKWSYNSTYILEHLVPEEIYNFQFCAENDVGRGPWAGNQQIRMPKRSVPAEPKIIVEGYIPGEENTNYVATDIVTNSKYADHYKLQWTVPHDNGDPIDYYELKYCVTQRVNGMWRTSESECSEIITTSFLHTTYDMSSLTPDTTYKVELKAHNTIGLSSPAEIRVKTARGLNTIVYQDDSTAVSSATIIGIVVGAILLVIIMVDIMCCCVNRAGILACLCDHLRSKPVDEEDPKLGSDEKEPLKKSEINQQPIILNGNMTPSSMPYDGSQLTPPYDGSQLSQSSVQYDGKHVYTKSGEIIVKHSVV